MSNESTNGYVDYDAVLADLQAKRDQIDAAIAAINLMGWNTEWIPCEVVWVTAKGIQIVHPDLGRFTLNRQTMEHDGCQYHSRVHEYFFAQKPNVVGDYIGRVVERGQLRD